MLIFADVIEPGRLDFVQSLFGTSGWWVRWIGEGRRGS